MGGGKTSLINSTNNPQQQSSSSSISKPLVALLDGRDCSVEMPLLKDIATVAFCDAHLTTEIHEKVLNEAVAAFLYTIRISREDLVKFRSLKLLVKIGNPDLSNIDVDAATQLGIAVCNTPADALEETADHTMSLILNLYRRTYWLAQTSTDKSNPSNLKNPQQLREGMSGTRRIRGQTLGIVGFGRVGCAVALRAKTFGFRVCFYDPNASLGMDRVFGVDRTENLTDLLTQSDCLTLHCKLTTETRLLLNNSTLDRLKPGAFLINTSDPDLIDQHALISFLKSGHVKAAALDIPCCGDNQQIESAGKIEETLLNSPNVICTPSFAAWFSEESLKDLRISAAREVRRALIGSIPESLQNCVNKDQLLNIRLVALQQRFPLPPAFALAGIGEDSVGLQPQNLPSLPPNLLTDQFFINQNNNPPQQPKRSVSTAAVPQQFNLPQSSTTTASAPSLETDPSAAANFVNNATALMAYQSLMMRNPQYFAAAAAAFSSPPTTCSSAVSLNPGNVGGPFEFSPPPNFLSSIPSIPFIGGITPPFSIAANIGETSTANSSSSTSLIHQQQQTISSSRGISKSPVSTNNNKSSPQQKYGGRGSQPGIDGCIVDNVNNSLIDTQQSSQWSPISENSSFQTNRDQHDVKINEHKVEIYEETGYNNQQLQNTTSPQRILPRTSTPYSPEGRQLVIDDNADDNSDDQHIRQHNFGENYNNGGAE